MASAVAPELLVLMSVAPELSFFHGSGFCLFSYINTCNCLGLPQVEWTLNYN